VIAPEDVAAEPALLAIADNGLLTGATGHYEKFLGDLGGVYLDDDAYQEAVATFGAEHLAYRVEVNQLAEGAGALIIGTSTVLPGLIGNEFAMTRGHLHVKSDRAELYHCVSGRGVMLMDTVTGESRALQMEPGKAVHVPGDWIHRSVNVGAEPLVTVFCYAADAGQDYQIIADAGGMVQLVVADGPDGWTTTANPRHIGYRAAAA